MRRIVRSLAQPEEMFGRLWPTLYSPWQMLDDLFSAERRTGPVVEVAEEGHDVVVRVELPGVRPEDTNVWMTDDRLTVRAERRQETRVEQEGFFHTERQYGSFQRVVPLPAPVESEKAAAKFENGVLEIRAPKRDVNDERFGRRIDVQ